MSAHLQKQGGLADTRIASHQRERAGHKPATKHPVKLGYMRGHALSLSQIHLFQTHRLCSSFPGSDASHAASLSGGSLLHHGIPFLAARTLSKPFGGFIAAALTKKRRRSSLCHILPLSRSLNRGFS